MIILQVLMDRAKLILADEDFRKKAIEAQMIQMKDDGKGSAMPSWVYLDCNPAEKKEVMDQNTPPIDQDRLLTYFIAGHFDGGIVVHTY